MVLTGNKGVRWSRSAPWASFSSTATKMHTEKLYADVSPLVPFMPWLVEA
jgi:hypothetical protein